MPNNFRIRFTGADGHGWRGQGELVIGNDELTFIAGRGWLPGPFLRTANTFHATSLREVIREGARVRIDYSAAGATRSVLFRAVDPGVAAEIVRLLPTTRTIEMEFEPGTREHETAGASSRTRRVLVVFGVLAALGSGLATTWMRNSADDVATPSVAANRAEASEATLEPVLDPPDLDQAVASVLSEEAAPPELVRPAQSNAPDPQSGYPTRQAPAESTNPEASTLVAEVAPRAAQPATPPNYTEAAPKADAEAEAEEFVPYVPDIRLPDDLIVVPIPQGTLAHDAARSLLARFEAGAQDLVAETSRDLERNERGDLKNPDLAQRLDSRSQRWRYLGSNVLDTVAGREPALTGLRSTLLGVVNYQVQFLEGYSRGLRAGDQARMDAALADRTRAQDMLARARLYVQ